MAGLVMSELGSLGVNIVIQIIRGLDRGWGSLSYKLENDQCSARIQHYGGDEPQAYRPALEMVQVPYHFLKGLGIYDILEYNVQS